MSEDSISRRAKFLSSVDALAAGLLFILAIYFRFWKAYPIL